MSVTVCIGGGKIGTAAALELRRRRSKVLVIDTDVCCPASAIADRTVTGPDQVLNAGPGEVVLLVGDGVGILEDIFARWIPDFVVPASPGHLAAYMAVRHSEKSGLRLFPSGALERISDALPKGTFIVLDRDNAVVVASRMADGIKCPDSCGQPATCPLTGTTSHAPMYEVIGKALKEAVDVSLVLSTHGTAQFGGVKGRDLVSMLSSLDGLEEGMTCGIATACGCHGIINLFRAVRPVGNG